MSNHKRHSLRQQSEDLVRQHGGLLNGLGQLSVWASVFLAVKWDYYRLLWPTYFLQI